MELEKLNNVLCINDNELSLFILKRTLTKSNFAEKVIEKKDGSEALDYCQELIATKKYQEGNYPKVIFLDLHMPVMDGWEFMDNFAARIWPYFIDTKIVINSQSIDKSDSLRARQHPFVLDFLKQPITFDYLRRLNTFLADGYSLQERENLS